MDHKQASDWEYTLDEIIAEVKSQAAGIATAEAAEPQDEDTFFQPQEGREEEKALETVVIAPDQVDPDMKIVPETIPKPRGKRLKPEEIRIAQQLLEEEEELAEQERKKRQAPWRTKKTVLQDTDTREFEAEEEDLPGEMQEEEEEDASAPSDASPLHYDFINIPYVDAASAVARLDKVLASISSRLLILLPVTLVAVYMTICMPLGWPMPFGFTYIRHPYLYLLVFCILQAVALILAYDVTAAGLRRLARGRPTADTLVLFCSLCSMAHVISIILKPEWGGYLPYSAVAVFTCFFALLAKRQRVEGLRRTYKASLLGTVPAAVKLRAEETLLLAVKTEAGAYVDNTEFSQRDTTEKLSEIYAPLAMIATVALAVAASFGRQRGTGFLWCLAAISSVAAPASLLLSSSMPTRSIIKKLYTSGSGLVNNTRTAKLAKCNSALLRDGDVFPNGSIELLGMKIAQSQKLEHVLGYAAAMLADVGGGLAKTFGDFARMRDVPPMEALNIRYYESGGMSAEIGPKYVLLGTLSFMMRMGVRVNTAEVKKVKGVTVFMAIDDQFAGIFSLKYTAQPQPFQAFNMLRHQKAVPILATKDFNLDQAYVESRFDLRADSTEYPELLDRLRLSDTALGAEEETLAFLSRDGMLPFVEAVTAAKKLRRAVKVNLILSLMASGFGLLLTYYLTSGFNAASVTPGNILAYLLLWLLATVLGSGIITKM